MELDKVSVSAIPARRFPAPWKVETIPGGFNVITDFATDEGDKIDLTDLELSSGKTLSFIGRENFTHTAGQMRESFSGGDTIVLPSQRRRNGGFQYPIKGPPSAGCLRFRAVGRNVCF